MIVMKKGWKATSHYVENPKIIVVSNYDASNKVCNYGMDDNRFPSSNDIGQWNVKYHKQ